jgi:hypothetical protein
MRWLVPVLILLAGTTEVHAQASGTAAGRQWELFRIPTNPVTMDKSVILRVTPLGGPLPACEVTFTYASRTAPLPVSDLPSDACATEPQARQLFFIRCAFGGCDIVDPSRGAVAVQVDGVTVLSLPALGPAPEPTLSVRSVNTGCEVCQPGQVLDISVVVHNSSTEDIIADYRPYGFTTDPIEFLIEWASGVFQFPPGNTELPITGPWSVPADIPNGFYFFGARLLFPGTGRLLTEIAPAYRRIEKVD